MYICALGQQNHDFWRILNKYILRTKKKDGAKVSQTFVHRSGLTKSPPKFPFPREKSRFWLLYDSYRTSHTEEFLLKLRESHL